jgi:hypothetical protein
MRHSILRVLSAVLVFRRARLRDAAVERAAAAGNAASGSAALIGEILSERNGMEEDLRVLTDEIGGRITGSPAYEAALQWGVEAFRRAGVESVRLESYDAAARWEAESATASGRGPLPVFAARRLLLARPFDPGRPDRAAGGRGRGTQGGLRQARGDGAGSDRSRPQQADEVARRPVRRVHGRPRDAGRRREERISAILLFSSRPRDLLYRHQVSLDGTVSALADGPGRARGRAEARRLLEKGRKITVSWS